MHCNVIARPRLPRGRRTRTGKAHSDLKARLQKLEDLVNTAYAQHGDDKNSAISHSSNTPPFLTPQDENEPSNAPKGVSRFVGREFWAGLSQEVCITLSKMAMQRVK